MACHCSSAAVTATEPMTYLQGQCEQGWARTMWQPEQMTGPAAELLGTAA
jgi:hypothetical protein